MRIQILDYQVGPHTFRMVNPSDFNIFKALPSLIPFITTIDTTQKVIFETEIDDDETTTDVYKRQGFRRNFRRIVQHTPLFGGFLSQLIVIIDSGYTGAVSYTHLFWMDAYSEMDTLPNQITCLVQLGHLIGKCIHFRIGR